MPQPLSNMKVNKFVFIDSDVTVKQPNLCAKIMKVIAIWSDIETKYTQIATTCLNSDFLTVNNMLQAISSSEGKRAAIKAAVKSAYPQHFDIFEAVEKVIKPSRDRRNEFAHHVWVNAPGVPDSICLVDPKHIASQGAESKPIGPNVKIIHP